MKLTNYTEKSSNKSLLYLFVLLLAMIMLIALGNTTIASASSRAFPDQNGNGDKNFLTGVVSTGTIGRFSKDQTGGIEIKNDFYGPDTWIKAYSDTPFAKSEFNIDFQGSFYEDMCNADHDAKVQIEFWNAKKDGTRGGYIDGSRNTYYAHRNKLARADNDLCKDGGLAENRTVKVHNSNWWTGPEDETQKYTVFIKVSIFNESDINSGVWNQDAASESELFNNHLKNHPNHPLGRFFIRSKSMYFGNWGMYQSGNDALESPTFLGTKDPSARNNVLNTQYNDNSFFEDPARRRVYRFSPSCKFFEDTKATEKDVWVYWFDDDVDLDKDEAKIQMIFEDVTTGQRVKTINGYNERLDVAKDKPKEQLQKNLLNPNDLVGYANPDGSGEGFGGKGQPGRAKIRVKEGHKYQWIIRPAPGTEGINDHRYTNKIAMWIPFDNAFPDEKNCDVPETGDLTCDLLKIPAENFSGTQRYQVWIKNTEFSGGPGPGDDSFQFNSVRDKATGGVQHYLSLPTNPNAPLYSRSGDIYAYVRIYKTDHENDGTHKDYQLSIKNCYQASCKVDIYGQLGDGNITNNGKVEKNKLFGVVVTISNTGDHSIPLNFVGPNRDGSGNPIGIPLIVAERSAWFNWNYGITQPPGSIPAGATRTVPILIGAKNDISRTGLLFFIQYPSALRRINASPTDFNLAVCGAYVDTYQHFNITPTADVQFDDNINEDPKTVTFSHGWEETEGPAGNAIRVTGARHVKRKGVGQEIFPQPVRDTYLGQAQNVSPPSEALTDVQVGDQYCAQTWINRGSGWIGPGGPDDVVNAVDKSSAEQCIRVSNKPYLRAYGGDVSAGGWFAGQATKCQGGINAYTRTNGPTISSTRSGSGVQFAALAIDTIKGFTSASLRSANSSAADAKPPFGLSFSNQNFTPSTGNSIDSLAGGSFGWCPTITDYYGTTKYLSNTDTDSIDSGIITNKRGQTHLSGNQTIGNLSVSSQRAVYVEGDVYIDGNITYADNGSSTKDMPNFALIVKGNIYIAPGVTQLDGLYVAQPKNDGSGGVSGGVISTCASENGVNKVNYTECKNQLTVNGAFVADYIHFLRTINTLRDSKPREKLSESSAAEIFNLNPEVYLANPAFRSEGGSSDGEGIGKYDFITTLPPIL